MAFLSLFRIHFLHYNKNSSYAACDQNDNLSDWTEATWENCTLRHWLNSTFLEETFTAEEIARIPTVTVPAEGDPACTSDPGNDTEDQIFLLSYPEVENISLPTKTVSVYPLLVPTTVVWRLKITMRL